MMILNSVATQLDNLCVKKLIEFSLKNILHNILFLVFKLILTLLSILRLLKNLISEHYIYIYI